jgi:hypothetical protein
MWFRVNLANRKLPPARVVMRNNNRDVGPSGGTITYDTLTSAAAVAAADAYINPASDESTLLSDPLTDAQAVVTIDDHNRATVAFRGTSSTSDWRANMWFPLKSLPSPHRKDAKAHSGFLSQYMSLHAHIVKHLDERAASHVVLTGHSLGGALAVIAAALLPDRFTYDVVTFGAPRAGNKELGDAAYHKCRTCIRVVHDRDVVPLVPIQAFGFKHICEPWVLLNEGGCVTPVDREYSFWQQCWLRACGLLENDYGILDHAMRNYIKGVAKEEVRQEKARSLEMVSVAPSRPGTESRP